MGRLHETLAVEPTVKGQASAFLTTAHHTVTKPALLAGLSRTYQPRDDDGDQLPPESTRVQVRADVVLRNVAAELARWFDVTATKEVANQHATANVVVDGTVLIPRCTGDVPPVPGETTGGLADVHGETTGA
jgi:hypothetical protein